VRASGGGVAGSWRCWVDGCTRGALLNPATSGVCGRVGERHANEAVATPKRAERGRVCYTKKER